MHIRVSKSDLEATLQVAGIAISGSGNDLSTHYLFRIKNGKVEVLTYNGQRICSKSFLVCQIEDGEDGEAMTIEGWRLTDWLGGVQDAALDLEHTKGEIKATSPRGTIHIKALDPAKFPFFDKSLAAAEHTGSVPADRLKAALGYVKYFIADTETQNPAISQTEVIDGALWATDKKAVTIVRLSNEIKGENGDTPSTREELLTGTHFRIQVQDIPSIVKFLGLRDTGNVDILEHSRTLFLRRGDGAILGASRPLMAFPVLKTPGDADADQATWVLKTAELQDGFSMLRASAEKGDTRIQFQYDAERSQVRLSVKSASGKQDSMPIDLIEEAGSDTLPEEGFVLDHPYLSHIMSHFGGDTLTFGITQAKKGGYVRFRHDIAGDSFVTVAVWRL